jgi:hypothetical protein
MILRSENKQYGRKAALMAILLCSILVDDCVAFSFPGLVPKGYDKGSKLRMMASLIMSDKTKLPYDFYDTGICKPEGFDTLNYKTLNWGESLAQEHWVSSPYFVALDNLAEGMTESTSVCKVACQPSKYLPAAKNRLTIMAARDYSYKFMLDDLPSATITRKDPSKTGSDLVD